MRKLLSVLSTGAFLGASAACAEEADWRKVDEALGRTAVVSGDVHRYGFPRSDLVVTLDGVAIKPTFALGGWIAFKPEHGKVMAMGDLVLLESEVSPVVAKLLEGGLEITAVHNHLLRATPAPIYVHVGGSGEPLKIAAAIRDALSASKTPLTTSSAPAPATAQTIELDTAQLDEIIGAKGKASGGVYQFSVPRRGQIVEGETPFDPPGPTGVATSINFQPTGGGKAAITGDFTLIGDEVNAVVRALRSNGIEVTALLLFLHFWANDDALKLARGLRAALDKVDISEN